MKKIFFTSGVLILLIHHNLFSQKITEEQLPLPVKESFSEKYKQVKVKWMKNDEGNFEGTFKQNKKEVTVIYSANGKWTETQTEIDIKDLPSEIITFIFEKYKGYIMEVTQKVERANGITFHLQLEDTHNKKIADLIFDKNGSVREEVMKDEK